MPQKATLLCFETAGSPASMNLTFKEFEIPDPGPDEVQIAFIFAPVTPTDILAISGKYPLKPIRRVPRGPYEMTDPYIAGYDGVARVTKIGELAPRHVYDTDFREGDIVVPFRMGIGTWCSHANVHENWLLNLSCNLYDLDELRRSFSPIDIETFSYLRSVFCTGRFLVQESFYDLKSHHCIVMNEPVDPISWAIISLVKAERAKVLVVLEDQPEMKGPSRLDPRKRILKDQGVDCVLLESEIERYQEEIENMRIVSVFDSGSSPSVSPFVPFLRLGGSVVNYAFLCGSDTPSSLTISYYRRDGEIPSGPFNVRSFLQHFYNRHMDYTGTGYSPLEMDVDYPLRDLVQQGRLKTPTIKRIPWSARDEVLKAVSTVEEQETWRDMYVIDFEA
ncbi:NAD(P)-binding protein [Penicillium malachiteum]|uniref:NAD(P)-binding protein n=1 Tax=Penicillium malachiteum TaxID=1324776 RepID=UPI002547E459|nr:NAD(P)-binding protein [Penicillium malachiteum]KAJ5725246.1 NAD(P)-binding protein [Penicillium malachiteum]